MKDCGGVLSKRFWLHSLYQWERLTRRLIYAKHDHLASTYQAHFRTVVRFLSFASLLWSKIHKTTLAFIYSKHLFKESMQRLNVNSYSHGPKCGRLLLLIGVRTLGHLQNIQPHADFVTTSAALFLSIVIQK
jgi:hypothetical protein